jgi:hypothetical protein
MVFKSRHTMLVGSALDNLRSDEEEQIQII